MNRKPFGYKGEPLTCRWCGKRLHYETVLDADLEKAARAAGASWQESHQAGLVRADKAGPYQDDSFCTVTCGYWFGLRMAELGHRLQA